MSTGMCGTLRTGMSEHLCDPMRTSMPDNLHRALRAFMSIGLRTSLWANERLRRGGSVPERLRACLRARVPVCVRSTVRRRSLLGYLRVADLPGSLSDRLGLFEPLCPAGSLLRPSVRPTVHHTVRLAVHFAVPGPVHRTSVQPILHDERAVRLHVVSADVRVLWTNG
jgi:hypothetical protein